VISNFWNLFSLFKIFLEFGFFFPTRIAIFWGKHEKNIVWDCLKNKKGSLCSKIKKSYLLQVLVVVLSCKGIKGKGGGRRFSYGGF
jgi:hypothetical protein